MRTVFAYLASKREECTSGVPALQEPLLGSTKARRRSKPNEGGADPFQVNNLSFDQASKMF